MTDSKDFVAGLDSNARKSPRRIVFVTRRTSPQVKAETEDQASDLSRSLVPRCRRDHDSGHCARVDCADVQRSA